MDFVYPGDIYAVTSLLGMHWLREHPDNNRDLAHIERMQYRSIKLFKNVWDNRDACAGILSVLPRNSYILARDHELSEQKKGMWSNPEAHGAYHANEWAMKVAMGQVYLPIERTFFLGINEPDATDGDRNAIDIYTEAFLDRLRVHGLRGGAFNFSTGHPRTVDGTPNTQADYAVFERSHQAIVRGHHIGVLHIYGTGAVPCAPGHYDRLKACTWQDVEWLVGEFGVDEHVIGGGEHHGFRKYFDGRLNDYCAWLDTAILGINDPRIHSYQVFTYDFSHPWDSFDVRPIRDVLEGYDWQHVKQPPALPVIPQPHEPATTHLPSIGTGPTPPAKPLPTTLWIRVIAANLRSGPSTEFDIVRELPQGTSLAVTGSTPTRDWLEVRVGDTAGWVFAALTSATPVAVPVPVEPPTQEHRLEAEDKRENWQRSRDFTARWEGGYQNVANDVGNWTGGAVGAGENKGTNFGISAASYPNLDIKNLTRAQADAIYERDYWAASGAAALRWPLCLLVFDTAILHGVGTARNWIDEVGPNPYAFAAKRLRVYTKMENWDFWGKAWTNRVADLLEEMAR